MSNFDFFTVTEEEQAQAQAYARLAAASTTPDIPANTPLRQINRCAIIGAGTMGSGIAMSIANIGIPVIIIDANEQSLQRGMERIRSNYAISVKRSKLSQSQVDQRQALITPSLDIADVTNVDLVIEAVFEDMQLKQDIFLQLDKLCRPGAILGTNTSGLDIDEIAAVTQRPQDVIGTHFFSPAHVMKLLEVVRGAKTSPEVIATLMDLGHRMGKVSVLARVYPGFIGNALFRNYTREAHFLVEDGALPHEVDAALTRFGYAMGIFTVHDMAGNDVGYQTRKAQMKTRPTDRRWNDLIMKLCDLNRFGQKSGKGWYTYPKLAEGDRTPQRDPALEQFVISESEKMGIKRRTFSPEYMIKRCLYGMINEGAKLLEQGIALRPSDIDATYLAGYGFPAHHGGPMYLADHIGLDNVLADIEQLHAEYGYWWTPAPLLKQLVSQGKCFADLQN